MGNWKNILTWLSLTVLIFAFFRWLFGMALADVALEFSLGTTFIIISGLFAGRALILLAVRMNGISNWALTLAALMILVVIGFVAIAFLLNTMIETKTTLFPFALSVLLLFLVTAACGAIVSIVRHQYKSRLNTAQAQMVQSKNELQLLQAQLSPHFLFNTLNNLYGLSLTQAQRVPPLLLKLSELLRYSVYDVKELFVPLQHEVDYIRNYVEFERLRLGERLRLHMEIEDAADGCTIPPLLLIVFVENAFKHSRSAGEQTISMSINLHKRDERIVFVTRNSIGEKPSGGENFGKHSGFGLESVRKRLNLLYPGKYSLKIDSTESEYVVHLELDC